MKWRVLHCRCCFKTRYDFDVGNRTTKWRRSDNTVLQNSYTKRHPKQLEHLAGK